jgi:hypothetical protein
MGIRVALFTNAVHEMTAHCRKQQEEMLYKSMMKGSQVEMAMLMYERDVSRMSGVALIKGVFLYRFDDNGLLPPLASERLAAQ